MNRIIRIFAVCLAFLLVSPPSLLWYVSGAEYGVWSNTAPCGTSAPAWGQLGAGAFAVHETAPGSGLFIPCCGSDSNVYWNGLALDLDEMGTTGGFSFAGGFCEELITSNSVPVATNVAVSVIDGDFNPNVTEACRTVNFIAQVSSNAQEQIAVPVGKQFGKELGKNRSAEGTLFAKTFNANFPSYAKSNKLKDVADYQQKGIDETLKYTGGTNVDTAMAGSNGLGGVTMMGTRSLTGLSNAIAGSSYGGTNQPFYFESPLFRYFGNVAGNSNALNFNFFDASTFKAGAVKTGVEGYKTTLKTSRSFFIFALDVGLLLYILFSGGYMTMRVREHWQKPTVNPVSVFGWQAGPAQAFIAALAIMAAVAAIPLFMFSHASSLPLYDGLYSLNLFGVVPNTSGTGYTVGGAGWGRFIDVLAMVDQYFPVLHCFDVGVAALGFTIGMFASALLIYTIITFIVA